MTEEEIEEWAREAEADGKIAIVNKTTFDFVTVDHAMANPEEGQLVMPIATFIAFRRKKKLNS